MTDLVMSVVFIVIAVAVVARTVFYAIEVLTNTKVAKKSLKLVNRYFKALEPVINYLEKSARSLDDDI